MPISGGEASATGGEKAAADILLSTDLLGWQSNALCWSCLSQACK